MRIEDGTHVTSQYFHSIFLVGIELSMCNFEEESREGCRGKV